VPGAGFRASRIRTVNEDGHARDPATWHRTHRTLIVTSGVVLCLALAVLALWLVLRPWLTALHAFALLESGP
jgi:hypothetical protein